MALRPRLVLLALAGSALLAACSDEVPAPETPAPSASPEPTPDLPSLTLGPEVALPDDIALLLETGCFQCDGPATGLSRVYRDGSGAVRSELLVSAGPHSYYPDARTEEMYFADDIAIAREMISTTKGLQEYDPWVSGIAVGPDGSEIIVSVCTSPACNTYSDGWAPPGRASLYRSTDSGENWDEYDDMVGGAVVGLLGPGRALAYRYSSLGELKAYTGPDGSEVSMPESTDPIAPLPFVLSNGTIAWPSRSGDLRRPDGSTILKVPSIVYCPCGISWVTQQESGQGLIAVGWTGNTQDNEGFVSLFTRDGEHVRTFATDHGLLYAVWLSEDTLAGNVGIEPEELAKPAPKFFPYLLPAVVDLNGGKIHPVTEYFLDDGAEMGRNFVRGVQHLSAR